jgi:hypothetical protein
MHWMADAATSPTKTQRGSGNREMPLDVRGRQTSRACRGDMKHAVQLASGPDLEWEWEYCTVGLGIEGEIRSSRGSMQALMQCNETSNPTTPAGRGRVKNNLDRSPGAHGRLAAGRVRYGVLTC